MKLGWGSQEIHTGGKAAIWKTEKEINKFKIAFRETVCEDGI
jgi:hypothetical protein